MPRHGKVECRSLSLSKGRVLGQTLSQAQGDRGFVNVTVVCLEIFATYGICGTTRGWSEGETSPSLGNRCRGYSQRSFERTSPPFAVFLN